VGPVKPVDPVRLEPVNPVEPWGPVEPVDPVGPVPEFTSRDARRFVSSNAPITFCVKGYVKLNLLIYYSQKKKKYK
jgi:hypothetical protein